MATETILEVMFRSEHDGRGSTVLKSFERKEMHSKKEIKKMRNKHKVPKTKCSATASICTRQSEMRWIEIEKAFECRFSIADTDGDSLAKFLKSTRGEQEKTGFETDRLYSVHLYLADNPDRYVVPNDTSIGIKLLNVQISEYEESGNLAIVEFIAAKDSTPEPNLL